MLLRSVIVCFEPLTATCMFVRQQKTKTKKNNGPLLFDRSYLDFNAGQVFKFFRLVHA